jgi:RHS repeat-associated protein
MKPRRWLVLILLSTLVAAIPGSLPVPAWAATLASDQSQVPPIPPQFLTPMTRPSSASTYLAPPKKTVPKAKTPPPPTPAAPNESWTATSHSITNSSGLVTKQVWSEPAFRHSGSAWLPIDTTLTTTASGSFPINADKTVRPIHFGNQAGQLIQVDLDKGPVTLSAPSLTISAPSISGNQIVYAEVGNGVDLNYRVLPGGIKEQIVLHSATAPTTYTFHLADPAGQLGQVHQLPDGSWVFDVKVDGLSLQLAPAFAYVEPRNGAPPNIDPKSAHLVVAKLAGGFDLTISVDPTWLAGKTFPIVLDPSLNFSPLAKTGVDFYTPNGCGGCNTVNTNGELYASTYTAGSYDLEPGRSFLQFDLSQIPAGSQVTSAQLVMEVGGCIGPTSMCSSHSQGYVIELHQLTGSWTTSSTWTQLSAITSSSVLVSYNQAAFSGTYFNETFASTSLTNQVQSWVNASSSNYGFEAQLQNDTASGSYNIGGPFYCLHGTWWCLNPGWSAPSLQVNYNTVPAAPPTVSATAGDQNAAVTWGVPNNGGSAITGYTVLTQDANGNPFGSPVNACATCTSATVTGLSYGLNYRFGVYATNAVGNSPTTWSSYDTVPLPITLTMTTSNSLYARGQVAGYSLVISNPAAITVNVGGITDAMAPVLTPGGTSVTMDGLACTLTSSPSCAVSAYALTIGGFSLTTGQSHTFLYTAVAIGIDRGCAAISDGVGETTTGGLLNRSAAINVCDTGLGVENWWSYVGRNVTVNSQATIDVANGNLVVQETDATPIQARGQLSFALQRTYNSQNSGVVTPPGSLGSGWVLSLTNTGGTVASAVGLYIPGGETVSNPLAVTVIDGDGTRHVFQLKSVLATAVDATTSSSGPIGLLVPQALTLPTGYTKVCVDTTFSAPPGAHLSLWRYLASSTPCSSLSPSTSQILGYGAVRPDRVRYEFSADGRILDVGDGNGDHIRYVYDGSNRISTLYEPRSCSYPPAATCRTISFSYPGGQETDVVDPAGRTTKYKFDTATPAHLVEVDNPDGSRETYAYGGCTGSSANQLCQVTDLRNNHSSFTYVAITGQPGPAGASQITDRRGTATTLTYWRPTQNGEWADYVTSDQGGERRTFLGIDTSGRVGEIREGASSDNYLHQALYTWDVAGATCRQPDNVVDNNLCRLQRISLPGASTPNEDSSYVFNPEGKQLKKHQANGSAAAIDTTSGFHAQYVESSGSVNGFDDSVAGSGTVNSAGSTRSDSGTVYYISDTTQDLTPRGNAAGSGYAAYLTTYRPDNLSTISPGAAPSGTICSAGAATNNTGHICEVDEPTYDGTHATVKRYTYDAFGEKSSYTTPDAMAQSPTGASYVYTYYQDTDLDLSGSVSPGGWLKAETDPTGNFVVFGYDRAGNVVRTWDRDSTSASGLALSAFPGTLASPPSDSNGVAPYKETIFGTYSLPWRYLTSSKDPVGNLTTYTLDADGNQLAIRPPRGNVAGNSSFDINQTFDPNDNLLTKQLPVEASGGQHWIYTYNAFNSLASTTDPNGSVVVSSYDTINRPTGTIFTRAVWPTDTTTVPPSCRESVTGDAPILAGRILCSTTIAYDSLDNVIGTTDANGQTSTTSFDGLHRKLIVYVPRNDGAITNKPTQYAYDADGNVTDLCPPREYYEGAGWSCTSSGQYSQHWTYDKLGRKTTLTTYRSGSNYPTNTTTFAYDADGNLISTTDPRGSAYAVTDAYDLNDRKLSETKPRTSSTSYTTSWTYSPSGSVLSETRPGGLITAYSYDADQRPIDTVTGASSTLAAAAWPVDTTNGGSNIRTRVVYDPDGNVIQRYDPRAFTTQAAGADIRFMLQTDYDADGRPIKQYVPRYDNAGGTLYTDEAVDGNPGNPSTGTQASQCNTGVASYGSTVGVCVTSTQYDYAGNRVTLWLPTSNGTGNRYIAYTYTDDNLVATVDQPSPIGSGRAVTKSLYDADGNLVKTTDPLTYQNTSYFADGQLKQTVNQPNGSLTHVTSYQYNANDQKTRLTDGDQNISTWTFFSDGLLKEYQDEAGNRTDDVYDQVGNIIQLYSPSAMARDQTNPSGTPTVNLYNNDNTLYSSTQPVTSTTYRRHVYSYDSAGRKTADHTYLLDQNYSVLIDDGTLGYVYYNDDRLSQRLSRFCCSDLISYSYDPAGNMTLATDNTNRPYSTPNLVFTYYLDSSLRSAEDTTNSLPAIYSYDGSGNRVGRAEPVNNSSGRALTTYTYNDAGLMATMRSVVTNTSQTTFTYNADGNLLTEHDPNSGVWTLVYNTDLTLASATLTNAPYTQASWTYVYDGDYKITQQTFSGIGVQGGTPVQGTASYTYDGAGRISYMTLPGQSGQTVTWDHDGNRLTYSGVTYTYNMDDSIATAGATSFTYFATGARQTDGSHFYCYDGYDRLFRATTVTDVGCNSPTVSYASEGLDRQRAHDEGSGSTFVEYDGNTQTISAEYPYNSPSGAGNVYALAGGRRTAVGYYANSSVASGTINYLADDGQGNISTATTQGGAMACTAWSDAWGVPMSPISGTNPCNTGSTIATQFYRGSRRDSVTGDYQFGPRTYDPQTGSFLQPDTFRGSAPGSTGSVVSDPLTRNRYAYVNGDPLNLIDPSGHYTMASSGSNEAAYVDKNPSASTNSYANCAVVILGYNTCQHAVAVAAALSEGSSILPDWSQLTWSNVGNAAVGWGDQAIGSVGDLSCLGGPINAFECAVNGAPFQHVVSDTVDALGGQVDRSSDAYNDGRIAFTVASIAAGGYGAVRSAPGLIRGFVSLAKGGADVVPAAEADTSLGAVTECMNSFTAGTLVLLASGSKKPIEHVKVGDVVIAGDPLKRTERAEQVQNVIVGHGNKHLVQIHIDGDIIDATYNHPFWSATNNRFELAQELKVGERLLLADGELFPITAVHIYDQVTTVYNLSIRDIHTFYVGPHSVLVHNCPRITPGSLPPDEESAVLNTAAHIDAGTTPTGSLATNWGIPFENAEGHLPGGQFSASPYTEYRVAPPPGTSTAGLRRIVLNNATGEMYYTWTHYGTVGSPPFVQIR